MISLALRHTGVPSRSTARGVASPYDGLLVGYFPIMDALHSTPWLGLGTSKAMSLRAKTQRYTVALGLFKKDHSFRFRDGLIPAVAASRCGPLPLWAALLSWAVTGYVQREHLVILKGGGACGMEAAL